MRDNMFKYGITATFEDLGPIWPCTLRGTIEEVTQQADELGYDGLELQVADPQDLDVENILKVCDQHDLKICAIATGQEGAKHGLWMTSPDPGMRKATAEKFKLHADFCQKTGALLIIGSLRKNVDDIYHLQQDLEWHDEVVYDVVDYAAKLGVEVVIENVTLHLCNWMNTMKETANYVRHINRDNCTIHLDSYTMLMEDNDIAGCYNYCADKLGYVHFTDGSRLYPGGSNVDFRAHYHALLDIGYKGWVSIECRPYPDPYTCAKFSMEYMKAMEKMVRIERYKRERPLIEY